MHIFIWSWTFLLIERFLTKLTTKPPEQWLTSYSCRESESVWEVPPHLTDSQQDISADPDSWWPQFLWGQSGDSGWLQVGHSVQLRLDHKGSHGGLQAARPGLLHACHHCKYIHDLLWTKTYTNSQQRSLSLTSSCLVLWSLINVLLAGSLSVMLSSALHHPGFLSSDMISHCEPTSAAHLC